MARDLPIHTHYCGVSGDDLYRHWTRGNYTLAGVEPLDGVEAKQYLTAIGEHLPLGSFCILISHGYNFISIVDGKLRVATIMAALDGKIVLPRGVRESIIRDTMYPVCKIGMELDMDKFSEQEREKLDDMLVRVRKNLNSKWE